jgi:predicted amidohydrolase
MIVSPWGEVLAEAGEDPQVLFAEIDPRLSEEARAKIPSLKHGRDFEVEIAAVPRAKPATRREAS